MHSALAHSFAWLHAFHCSPRQTNMASLSRRWLSCSHYYSRRSPNCLLVPVKTSPRVALDRGSHSVAAWLRRVPRFRQLITISIGIIPSTPGFLPPGFQQTACTAGVCCLSRPVLDLPLANFHSTASSLLRSNMGSFLAEYSPHRSLWRHSTRF